MPLVAGRRAAGERSGDVRTPTALGCGTNFGEPRAAPASELRWRRGDAVSCSCARASASAMARCISCSARWAQSSVERGDAAGLGTYRCTASSHRQLSVVTSPSAALRGLVWHEWQHSGVGWWDTGGSSANVGLSSRLGPRQLLRNGGALHGARPADS